ncbi:MAG: hypothetical protein QF632_04680 [Candidatus Woesearchaeota archaeon]|nr:hypothetical protein [Candidatus Woesearchaeota archaeon]MDP7457148.1 hypothetical protein [Candidatus Woesearchaeota archaeon]
MEFQSDDQQVMEKKVHEEFFDNALKIAQEQHSKAHKNDDFEVKIVKDEEVSIVDEIQKLEKHDAPHKESEGPMYSGDFSGIHGVAECTCGWKKPLKEVLAESQKAYGLKPASGEKKEDSHGKQNIDNQVGYAANKKDDTYKKEGYQQ